MGTQAKIPCPLGISAQTHPDATALKCRDAEITYAQLDRVVDGVMEELQRQGLSAGSRLLVQVEPTKEHIALLFACWRIGILYIPMSPRLPEKKRTYQAELTQTHQWLGHERTTPPAGCSRLLPWSTLFPANAWEPTETRESKIYEIPAEQPATALLTSGSTHLPKAALHAFQNHFYSALGSNENITLHVGDTWLLSLPLYHVSGIAITMRCVVAGATIALPRMDRELSDQLTWHKPSHVSMVTTQLSRLLAMDGAPRKQLAACRAILLGGSAMPKGLLKAAQRAKLSVYTSYGSTEMSSQITTTQPGDSIEDWCRAGHLLAHRELAFDENGEIMVSGKTRFLGYLTPTGIQQPFDEDGWFATGDIGHIDEDGALVIKGRKDSMFISGGENIQPEEIERALEQHDDVEQVIVVDVPSKEFGARPCAFVKMKAERPLRSQELKHFLKQHIASFKVPDRFFHWPQEPPQAGIKINRTSLREIAHRA